MIDIVEVLAFFVGTGVLPALLVGLVGSVVVTVVVVRRGWLQTPPWLVLAAVLSVVGILVFTLFRESVLIVQEVASGTSLVLPGWRGLSHWSPDGWWRATADPLRSTQVLLNIALFVPAGFVWTYLTRRPVRVLAALAALSVAIEVIQAVTGLGANDVADIIANLAGAAVGTAGQMSSGGSGKERWSGCGAPCRPCTPTGSAATRKRPPHDTRLASSADALASSSPGPRTGSPSNQPPGRYASGRVCEITGPHP
ncbi:MAG: VanZ family protein [Intrasporangiaceae bacterium]|nr:VanZ family protein [Intrasporangiaceae bacterium]